LPEHLFHSLIFPPQASSSQFLFASAHFNSPALPSSFYQPNLSLLDHPPFSFSHLPFILKSVAPSSFYLPHLLLFYLILLSSISLVSLTQV